MLTSDDGTGSVSAVSLKTRCVWFSFFLISSINKINKRVVNLHTLGQTSHVYAYANIETTATSLALLHSLCVCVHLFVCVHGCCVYCAGRSDSGSSTATTMSSLSTASSPNQGTPEVSTCAHSTATCM